MAVALGIETSCDDCSVSLVKDCGEVLFLSRKSQDQTHKPFGGIVPELASRRHEESLLPLIDQALKAVPLSQIGLIAVANRPGLLGSLLAGCVTAKSLSMVWNKPLVGVNHIEAHIFSPALFHAQTKNPPAKLKFPALAFVVSGGHSSLFQVEDIGWSFLLASTRDDAAGEAFDKFARKLGLPWPGGPAVDRLSKEAPQRSNLKKSFFSKIKTDDLSFSFSGIKSQGQRLLAGRSSKWIEEHKARLCADYQEAIVDHLMDKFKEAFKKQPVKQALIGGGVSANSLFRDRLRRWAERESVPCLFPEKMFCVDNGAMIAFAGLQYFLKGITDGLDMPCLPMPLEKDFFTKKPAG